MTSDDQGTPEEPAPEEPAPEKMTPEETTSKAPARAEPETGERPERAAETPEPGDPIKAELDDLREQASRRAKRSQRLSRLWATAHMLLGIAAAVLAAVAAGVVMTATIDDGVVVASAVVAAVLVVIMTFVHPDARGANARMIARGWNTLEVDLHVFLVAEYDETAPEARKDVLRSAMSRTLDLMAGRYEGAEPRRD